MRLNKKTLAFKLKFFVFFCPQLPGKLNELDNNGDLALDLALSRKLESIATTLVNNKADVDMVDQSGWSLLHKAIQRGKELLVASAGLVFLSFQSKPVVVFIHITLTCICILYLFIYLNQDRLEMVWSLLKVFCFPVPARG